MIDSFTHKLVGKSEKLVSADFALFLDALQINNILILYIIIHEKVTSMYVRVRGRKDYEK